MELDGILREGVGREASDIHLKVGAPPIFRVSGRLAPWEGQPPLTRNDMNGLCESLLTESHRQRLRDDPDVRLRRLPAARIRLLRLVV